MIQVVIPGYKAFSIQHLVLDVNGTVAVDGRLLPGVAEKLAALRSQVQIHLLTADTHGRQKEIDQQLDLSATILPATRPPDPTQRSLKANYVHQLGADSVVAVGNGNNDADMLKGAGVGIAVLGPEGLSAQAVLSADVLCASIEDALDLLLHPDRLRATLRI